MSRNPSVLLILCALLALGAGGIGCDDAKKTGQAVAGKTRAALKKEAPAASERGMLGLSDEEFRQKMEDDLLELRRYDQGLEQALSYARQHPELFTGDEDGAFGATQRVELRQIWGAVLDYMRALDGMKLYWRDFHHINPLKEKERHAAAFLMGYAAWMTQYHYGLEFIDMALLSRPMDILLDEPDARRDIPGKAFTRFKLEILHAKAMARLAGSRNYYQLQRAIVDEGQCKTWEACDWALTRVAEHHSESVKRLAKRPGIRAGFQAFDIMRDFGLEAWFPVQKGVAQWMGDTRVRRLHEHLVSRAQLLEMHAKMEPADIVVARKNWFLSNIGLPGFWPHAELYIGSPAELSAYFDTPEVTAQLEQELGGKSFTEHVKSAHPAIWASYQERPHGDPIRIIEATSEGVIFSALEYGAGADYVGVMRPRRSRAEKARAVLRALSYYGRPYDFNFDFLTDETVVCTELVYKAWEPTATNRGVEFDMVRVMGRNTLPANDMVRQFAEQLELPDETRQLDFVYFLDGHERAKGAIVSNQDAFKLTWLRPKWDVMQD